MALSIDALPSAILQEELIREQSADPDCQNWLEEARMKKHGRQKGVYSTLNPMVYWL
jgi:hypothetical protein